MYVPRTVAQSVRQNSERYSTAVVLFNFVLQ
uniref:Uncharacterized protein n=1 Tax=Anguilla anguilla TaxID=7936 RepID=A0A0E9Q4P4_ANGAN